MKNEKMQKILEEMNKPERCSKRVNSSSVLNHPRALALEIITPPADRKTKPYDEKQICAAKAALEKTDDRRAKIQILTTLSEDLSIRAVARLCNVSRRMASQAKKLRENEGYNATPPMKRGRKLSPEVVAAIQEFYTSEDASRTMPGSGDSVSVKTDTGREHRQKHLLLHNLDKLHSMFLEKHPEMNVSPSKFAKLRPKQCIPMDKNGCHNVCVCKTHENVKLKFQGVRAAFRKKKYDFTLSPKDAIKCMVCENPSPSCYLRQCKNCLKTNSFCKNLEKLFQDHSIDTVSYREWTNTDRYLYNLSFFERLIDWFYLAFLLFCTQF